MQQDMCSLKLRELRKRTQKCQWENGALFNCCIERNLYFHCQNKKDELERLAQQVREKEQLIRYALQTARIRSITRWLILEIEERARSLSTAQRRRILHSIKQVERSEYSEVENWEAVSAHVERFEEVGTSHFQAENKKCRICREEDTIVTHLSDCEIILACKACAIGWIEYVKRIKWLKLEEAKN